MTKGQIYIVVFLVLATFVGCKNEEDAAVQEVTAELAFSVSASAEQHTRMTANVVQANNNYRGITDLRIVPFAARGRKIQLGDMAKRERVNDLGQPYERTNSWFYYYQHCSFMEGVSSFLVYGRAIPTYDSDAPTMADKRRNGSLEAVFPLDMQLDGVSFTPTPIYGSSTADAKATALAAYLTAIANTKVTVDGNTTMWKNVTSSALKALYQNFIGQKNTETADLAGSSTNVLVFVQELYNQVHGQVFSYPENSVERELCLAILNTITTYQGITTTSEGTVSGLGTAMSGFPASIGLPDGAAVVRWTGTAFEPQTQTTTMDNITGIARYAYPAELYYYANSLIRTSTIDDRSSFYTSGTISQTWEDVLARYEQNPGSVTRHTKAVAIKEPVQYGVAHLQMKLKSVTPTLPDAAGTSISVGTNTFPLTAVIVGNQHPVGFDFKPSDTEDDEYFIYDTQVQKSGGANLYLSTTDTESELIHTLVLQSKDEEEVAVVLEFRNDGTQTFEGVDGLVYPGTKFYLVAKVKPETVGANAQDYEKRVFTQDCVTTMSMKVESLAKAYNVLPNLLSPRLEIGVEVITQWMQAEPTNVMLE
ncbi:MAG: hypothetical protein IJR02_10210 [Bacteroidaceae bacterium]|nr:hypothetical protein [Bacteroidaceae bacterium]